MGVHRSPGLVSDKDWEFLHAFHNRSLERFGHLDHLRLAWIVMRRHELNEGSRLIRNGLKEFAEYQGARNRYHETLTMFWTRIVHHAAQARADIKDFDSFLASSQFLIDKNLPLRHWTSTTLWSDSARAGWMEPDRLPLPLGPHLRSRCPAESEKHILTTCLGGEIRIIRIE